MSGRVIIRDQPILIGNMPMPIIIIITMHKHRIRTIIIR